jgi:hypothetical protein
VDRHQTQEEQQFRGTFQEYMEALDTAPLSEEERRVLRDAIADARAELGPLPPGGAEEPWTEDDVAFADE